MKKDGTHLYTPKNEHMDSRDDDDDDDSRGFDTTTTTLTTTTTTRAAKNTNTTNNNNNAVFFDKVKRMKEKAKQSASSGLQKMSRKIKIPSSSTSLSGGSGRTTVLRTPRTARGTPATGDKARR